MEIDLTDEQLRSELIKFGEKNIPPISEASRSILRKKLNHLMVKSKRQSVSHLAAVEPEEDPVSSFPVTKRGRRGRGRQSTSTKLPDVPLEEPESDWRGYGHPSTTTQFPEPPLQEPRPSLKSMSRKRPLHEQDLSNEEDECRYADEQIKLAKKRELLVMKQEYLQQKLEAVRKETLYYEMKLKLEHDKMQLLDTEVEKTRKKTKLW